MKQDDSKSAAEVKSTKSGHASSYEATNSTKKTDRLDNRNSVASKVGWTGCELYSLFKWVKFRHTVVKFSKATYSRYRSMGMASGRKFFGKKTNKGEGWKGAGGACSCLNWVRRSRGGGGGSYMHWVWEDCPFLRPPAPSPRPIWGGGGDDFS